MAADWLALLDEGPMGTAALVTAAAVTASCAPLLCQCRCYLV